MLALLTILPENSPPGAVTSTSMLLAFLQGHTCVSNTTGLFPANTLLVIPHQTRFLFHVAAWARTHHRAISGDRNLSHAHTS